jgi:uncharacterized protein
MTAVAGVFKRFARCGVGGARQRGGGYGFAGCRAHLFSSPRNRYMFGMTNTRARGEHEASDAGSPGSRWVEEVRRIVIRALREQDATVFLFGSWARGDATAGSDIDVAIEPHSSLPHGLLAELREGLEESRVPYRVDVVDMRDAAPALRRRILEEGIRWRG